MSDNPRMITALARIVAQSPDIVSATALTERLLQRAGIGDEESASFQLDNVAFDLALADGEGLSGLTFAVADAGESFRTCQRRALAPSEPVAFAAAQGDALIEGHRIDLDPAATFGVPISLVATATPLAHHARQSDDAAVTGLDHVVIRTTHPNRAAALYGARLGLDMRLDRTEPKWGSRLMFFRCGDLIVEIVHDLADEPSAAPDKLWGLSWRVKNADAAHARLKASGFDISEVRTGRKPGTRVFTVRNNTLGIPTLIVEPARRSS
jgi:catechol 2,3-dioxygenase-like lactoylglutathione lyase family enzyme